jgi:hypothetical protein
MLQTVDIPIAHIDDAGSVSAVLAALQALHGPDYEFAVGRWQGETRVRPQNGRTIYRFIVEAEGATVRLDEGDVIRGPSPAGPYRTLDGAFAQVTEPHLEALWPGDALTVDNNAGEGIMLNGRGVYFEVVAEQTTYCAPRLAMLRHLPDHPGGCAAYPGAFRRETLPPQRPTAPDKDPRGPNRVNEHTLDMRLDRKPTPIRHYHGQISDGRGHMLNHSETAIVLSRSIYGLPEVEQPDRGYIRLYRRPAEDRADQFLVPVRPGSIVVTPATSEGVIGHCFENAFAMLVAIPGFMVPYNLIL